MTLPVVESRLKVLLKLLQSRKNFLPLSKNFTSYIKGIGETVLSLDAQLVEPTEERDAQVEPEKFVGGDAEIVAQVKHLITAEKGEIIDVDNSEDKDGESDLSAGLTLFWYHGTDVREAWGCMLEVWLLREPFFTAQVASFPWAR